jgi:GT2 family glycosyltransferase
MTTEDHTIARISSPPNGSRPVPTVTIVFLVFNRREELRTSLRRMLEDSDYDPDRVDVIVVDNASSDDSGAMVRKEFPQVQVIARDRNVGVSGWNDGLAAARGEYVLALDDDCYLPPDGLRRAVAAAQERAADLVSFKVINAYDPEHEFTMEYRTGLFMYWGCAVLMHRRVVEALGGYDPEIFVWANELEFSIRFFDHGFRHLHLPEVAAEHMKPIPAPGTPINWRPYRLNARHFAYIAAKLMRPRDAAEALVALSFRVVRDGVNGDPAIFRALVDTLAGFVHGLRHRAPVSNAQVSHFYRQNFETFASPWWLSRPPREMLRALPREILGGGRVRESRPEGLGRVEDYYARRARYYPEEEPGVLEFASGPVVS